MRSFGAVNIVCCILCVSPLGSGTGDWRERGLQERLVSTHPGQARNPRHTPPPLANCSYTTPADGCVLVHQEKEAGVPGPQRQGKKKLALKSGLKTHLHYLEDDFKSACRWVIAGHTLASAIAQHYITMNFLGDSPCPGFPSRT